MSAHTPPNDPAETAGPTKSNEALRRRAEEIRKQQQKKDARSRLAVQLSVVVGALLVVALVVAAFILVPKIIDSSKPAPTTQSAVDGSVKLPDGSSVPIVVDGATITVGKSDAPVTIDYWFDFSCPHCIEYHHATEATFNAVVASGEAKMVYHPIQYVAPYGGYAGAATLEAVRAQPGLFFTIMDGIFAIPPQTQMNWNQENYAQVVKQLGLTDTAVVKEIAAGGGQALIAQATTAARDGAVRGTPSVAINGTMLEKLPMSAEIEALVKEAAAKQGAAAPKTP